MLTPIFAPESVGEAFIGVPGATNPERTYPIQRVVVVGHAADARLWQCAPVDRERCGDYFVVDRVVWVDDGNITLGRALTGVATQLTLEQAIAAADVDPSEVLAIAPVEAIDLGDIDPRLESTADGVSWIVRHVAESADEIGTAGAQSTVIGDQTSSVLAKIPLTVPSTYAPARLTLEASYRSTLPVDLLNKTQGQFTVLRSGEEVVIGPVSSARLSPLVIEPGSYEVTAALVDSVGVTWPGSACERLTLALEPLSDVALRAQFYGSGKCRWVETFDE